MPSSTAMHTTNGKGRGRVRIYALEDTAGHHPQLRLPFKRAGRNDQSVCYFVRPARIRTQRIQTLVRQGLDQHYLVYRAR